MGNDIVDTQQKTSSHHRHLDRKFLARAGRDPMQAFFVFGRIGRPHPGFDTVKGRGFGFRPGDDGGPGRGYGLRAEAEADVFLVVFRAEGDEIRFQFTADEVHVAGVGEGAFGQEILFRLQMPIGGVAEGFFGGHAQNIVRALEAGVPRQAKIKMMPGAPRNRRGGMVFQCEMHHKGQLGKDVSDRELVIERVGFAGGGGRLQNGGEAGVIRTGDGEFPSARETVHRHGAAQAVGRAPTADLALVKGAGHKGEENGVAAPDFGGVGEVGGVRPMQYGAGWLAG